MSEDQAEETRLCANCQRDIPATNFTIHEIHCRRNIDLCRYCHEPFPKSEMERHFETEHALVNCKCNMKVEKNKVEKHENLECPLRLVKCQYCELELAFNKSEEHADYCGSRTEPCAACGRNVLVKDVNVHHTSCGKDVEEKNNNHIKRSEYRFEDDVGTWFENQPFGIIHQVEENRIRARPRISRQLEAKVYGNRETGFSVRGSDRRNLLTTGRDQNQASLMRTERNNLTDAASPGQVDANSNLDYLLALSLQNENTDGGEWLPLWEDTLSDYKCPERQNIMGILNNQSPSDIFPTSVNAHEEVTNVTMLPCEFCEELFPEEELIIHQTGCNPVSAFASFSKSTTLIPPLQRVSVPRTNDIFSHRQRANPELFSEDYTLPSFSPFVGSSDGDVMIPCEFCGIALEEDMLYHHQDQCDLRPPTARPPDQEINQPFLVTNTETREPPQVPTQRQRRQGDVRPNYFSHLDDVQARPAIRPAVRTKPAGAPATFRQGIGAQKPLASQDTEASTLNTRSVKLPNRETSELRRRARKPLESSVGSVRPIGDVFPEGYKSNFPHAPTARSSLRTEGSRVSRSTVPPISRSRIPGIKNVPKTRPENDEKEEE
ncbi:TRAF-type zinc finger domain-containing protein 1-like isoform X2 [Stegostoma tigrinum]|uniref:TRAF-type zinc finger domain-containing protein 1-like isoform X2 n=1 Tax=Stegostoma tigrinum TaxID=3053191 RepID=UPI00202AEEA7|nr:TRAF-type zinc finger domain-containing protein 1-like isoform X2 [Stegostoma tigrinum]